MRRREIVVGLLAAASVRPAIGQGGRASASRLGYIWVGPRGSERSTLDGLRSGLRDHGYDEGRSYEISERYADLQPDRLPALVADLLGLDIRMLLAPGDLVIAAARQATSTLPILATSADLVASGFAASLSRPGGNITGISLTAGAALSQKWLEFVKEFAPHSSRVAVLANATTAASRAYLERIEAAATKFDMRVERFSAPGREQLAGALESIARSGAEALIVESDPVLVSNRRAIIEFAATRRLPAVYGNYEYARDGGLLSYGANIFDVWRRLATYVDQILKGARPAELPVEQATTFQLRINMATAKQLGLAVPTSLLARADEVIE